MQTFTMFIFWILMGAATAYFANQRGRDPFIWFLIGAFLGIFGLILLFILPTLTEDAEESTQNEDNLIETSHEILSTHHSHDYLIKDWFYLDKSGQQKGPVRYEALRDKWRSGQLRSENYVWSEGMENWKTIKELPDLQAALATTLYADHES